MRVYLLTEALFLLLLYSFAVAGRGDKAGTAAGTELLIPVGAKSIGLGCSPIATLTGIEAMYVNPAGLARSQYQTDVMFTHISYFASIGIDYAAIATNLEDIARVAVSVKSLSIGKIPITTEDYPDGTGETASPGIIIASGALSRMVTDHIAFGFSANIIFENMEKVSATGVAFSAGLQYTGLGGLDGLSVGVVLNNLGPSMKYDGDGLVRTGQVVDVLRPETTYKVEASSNDLPSTIEIGLGYERNISEKEQLQFTSKFQNNNYSDDEYMFGVELFHDHFLVFRGGYAIGEQPEFGEYIYGFSAGCGVTTSVIGIHVTIDYAYRAAKYFGGNHVITLNAGF